MCRNNYIIHRDRDNHIKIETPILKSNNTPTLKLKHPASAKRVTTHIKSTPNNAQRKFQPTKRSNAHRNIETPSKPIDPTFTEKENLK